MRNEELSSTSDEITEARESLTEDREFINKMNAEQKEIMSKWEGVGWHRDEIYFGILIGLRIAEDRRKRKPDV